MKRTYLILSIIGFIIPNIWVLKVTFLTGNFFLYRDPIATFNDAFANDISTVFVSDLFFTVLVFMIWSYHEAKKFSIKNVALYWILTFLFGIAGALPLFLFSREKRR